MFKCASQNEVSNTVKITLTDVNPHSKNEKQETTDKNTRSKIVIKKILSTESYVKNAE